MARANHPLTRVHLPSDHIQTTALSVSSKALHAAFSPSCVDMCQWLAESCRPWAHVLVSVSPGGYVLDPKWSYGTITTAHTSTSRKVLQGGGRGI